MHCICSIKVLNENSRYDLFHMVLWVFLSGYVSLFCILLWLELQINCEDFGSTLLLSVS